MEKRYPALHIISLLFKVLAIVIIVMGIFLIVVVLTQGDANLSFTFLPRIFGTSMLTLGVVPIILFTLVSALIFWGVAELLICLIDIENNTRAKASQESQTKEIQAEQAEVKPAEVTPVAQPAPTTNPPVESDEKKAAALAERKQNIKDLLNKKIW
jgi:hypothetical protein